MLHGCGLGDAGGAELMQLLLGPGGADGTDGADDAVTTNSPAGEANAGSTDAAGSTQRDAGTVSGAPPASSAENMAVQRAGTASLGFSATEELDLSGNGLTWTAISGLLTALAPQRRPCQAHVGGDDNAADVNKQIPSEALDLDQQSEEKRQKSEEERQDLPCPRQKLLEGSGRAAAWLPAPALELLVVAANPGVDDPAFLRAVEELNAARPALKVVGRARDGVDDPQT